jgi:hypothetical protein
MSIKAVKVGQVLYATDSRREGQLNECTVIEANIVNKVGRQQEQLRDPVD